MLKSRWKTLLIVLALAAVIGVAFTFVRNRPLSVPVAKMEENTPVKVFGLGTVEARVLTRIGFKVIGTLAELRADHGDEIKTGDVLARLDRSEQQARVAKAQAQLSSAEAAVRVAEAAARKAAAVVSQRSQTNQRRQALLARQAVSVEAAEEAQANEATAVADFAVAESEIASAKAKLDDARAQYEYEKVVLGQHELRAPFNGVVVSRARELGSVLGGGEALFTIVAPETVWMLSYIDEGRAGDIRVGQSAEVKLRSLPRQMFKGRVERIGIESDRVNEERRVYVTCDDCPESFFLGEQAEVFITTDMLSKALLVPEAAIEQYDGAAGFVWTIENGTLKRQRVALGKRALDSRIEILSGAPAGAQVVTALSSDMREGRWARPAGE